MIAKISRYGREVLAIIGLFYVHPLLASSPQVTSLDCATAAADDTHELCAAARLYMHRNAISEIKINLGGAGSAAAPDSSQCVSIEAPIDLDQWWCLLVLVPMTLAILCLVQRRLSIYYFPALLAMDLEPAQLQAYREQTRAVWRLTLIPCCLVIVFYHLYRLGTVGGASWDRVCVPVLIIGFEWIAKPPYDHLVRAHFAVCFIICPLLTMVAHLVGPSITPWPLIFALPTFGALLHDSVEQHLAHVLCQTCMVFMTALTNTARLTSVVATVLSTFLVLAKLWYFRASIQIHQRDAMREHVVQRLPAFCAVVCYATSLLLVVLSERMSQEFQFAVQSCWIMVAMALLLLSLLCMARPRAISDRLSDLGMCTDLKTVTLDQQYSEQMAGAARFFVLLLQPVLVVRSFLFTSALEGMLLCVPHSLNWVWLLYYQPKHTTLICYWTFLVYGVYPAFLLYMHFGLGVVFGTNRWPPIFHLVVVSTLLNTSLECHLGPLCCLSAVIFMTVNDNMIRGITVALVLFSSVVLVMKNNFIRRSIMAHQTTRLNGQYRAMNKLRETIDHQVKNTLMSCEYSISEAAELLLKDADKEEVLRALQTAEVDLRQASDECYQQHVLVEVNEGVYKLRPTELEIGAALRNACKHAIIDSVCDACWVLVDMALVQHVVNNAQSNGMQFGDRSGKHPLQLSYNLEDSAHQGKGRQRVLTLRLTNIAGSNHPSLIKIRDSTGCISMADIRKLHNWPGSLEGLGTDIICKAAQMLDASVHLEVTDLATTFVLSLPVVICDAPTTSTQLHQCHSEHCACAKVVAPKFDLSHIVLIQAHTGIVQTRALRHTLKKIGFKTVTVYGDSADSIRQAPHEIMAAEHPPQVIFVERYLNIPGLVGDEKDGTHIIRTLSQDSRVSGMLLLHNVPKDEQVVCKESHGMIQQDVPLADAFHASWGTFTSTRLIHSYRVCIVDDSAMVVQMTQCHLSRAGASVSYIESGDLFLAQGADSNFPWNFLVLDYTMPGRNGLETLQEIPEDVKARMTIIMHTSEPGAPAMEAFLAAGAIGCVPKKPKAYKDIIDLIVSTH